MSRKSKVEGRKQSNVRERASSEPAITEGTLIVFEERSDYGYENLDVWKKSRALARSIYEATGTGPVSKDFALQSQMRRAAVSIVSNISEGAERSSQKEFAQYVSHAKGSCGELRAQIMVSYDVGFLGAENAKQLVQQAREVSRMLGGLLSSIQAGRTRGKK